MAYQALYRAFRPRAFGDIRGQETVTRVLTRQIETGRVAHAYLFCGSRGTGKTTTARVFARAINCDNPQNGEACGECEPCRALAGDNSLDIIEIDAASNNGVDEIRDLRERVKYPPTIGKRKVYIIDEVHMLSQSAFNALLKTLEEPPAHAVFILGTTEPRKLPATILSRCQRFDFKRIPMAVIADQLRFVLNSISREATDEAVELIASSAEGALRDAISLLDMSLSFAEGELTADTVREVTGTSGRSAMFEYMDAIIDQNPGEALQIIDKNVRDGRDMGVFLREASEHLRDLLVAKVAPDAAAEILEITGDDAERYARQADRLTEARLSQLTELFLESESRSRWLSSPRAQAELTAVRACRAEEGLQLEAVTARLEKLESGAVRVQAQPAAKKPESAKPAEKKPAPKQPMTNTCDAETCEKFNRAMDMVSPMLKNMVGKGVRISGVRDSVAEISFTKAGLTSYMLFQNKNAVLAEKLSEVFGEKLALKLVMEEDRAEKPGAAMDVRRQIAQADTFFDNNPRVDIVD